MDPQSPTPPSPSDNPVTENPLGIPSDLPPLPPVKIDPAPAPAPETPVAPDPTAPTTPAPAAPVAPTTPAAPVTTADPFASLSESLAGIVGGKPATAAPGAPPNPNAPRDFSGLEPSEVEFFKQMSNGAYAHIYPKYLAAKQQQQTFEAEKTKLAQQVEEAKRQRLYEHAEAWKFDPEVQEATKTIGTIDTLNEFYLDQLANVKQNKPWNDVFTNEKGELVMGPAQQPSVQVEVAITNKLQQLASQKQMLGAQVFQRQQQFTSEFKNTYENLTQMRNKLLGPYEAILAPKRQAILEQFPKMIRDKPEIHIIADLINVLNAVIGHKPQNNANAAAMASAAPADPGAMTGAPSGGPSITEIEQRIAQMEAVGRGEFHVPQLGFQG